MSEFDTIIERLVEGIIKPFRTKYMVLSLSNEQIKNIILQELNKCLKNNQNNIDELNEDKLIENIDSSLSQYIIADLKGEKKIINQYINTHLEYFESSSSNLNQLKKLSFFYSEINYSIENIEECITIIQKNEILSKILASVVNSDLKDDIKDNVVASFIETYCMLHDIDLEDSEEKDLVNDEEEFSYETFYSDNSTNYYMQEIQQFPILTTFERNELLKRVSEGDSLAKEKMILCNLRLVRSVAKKYRGICKSLSFLDLMQEGTIGLMKAIDKFNPDKGCQFSTYAVWWIRQTIERAIDDKDRTIRIPVNKKEEFKKYQKTEQQLTQILGREPTMEEIAEKLGITDKEILFLYKTQLMDTISLQTIIGDDEYKLEDVISNSEESEFYFDDSFDIVNVVQELIEKANLTDIEKRFMEIRFGFGKYKYPTENLSEIGRILNISREWARQLQIRVLGKLGCAAKQIEGLILYSEDEKKAKKNIEIYMSSDSKKGSITTQQDVKSVRKILGCSDEQFEKVCSMLTEDERNLIELRDKCITKKDISELTNEQNEKIIVVLRKMRFLLIDINGVDLNYKFVSKSSKPLKTMFEILDCNEEEYNMILPHLEPEDLFVLELRNGQDLYKPVPSPKWNSSYSNIFGNLKPRMKNILKNLREQKKETPDRSFATMYELLGCTKEEYQLLLDLSSDDEKYILYLRNGEDVENPVKSSLWNKDYGKKFSNLVIKLRNILAVLRGERKSRLKTMYELLGCTKEEYSSILDMLSDEEKYILDLRNGKSLDFPGSSKEWNKNYALKFRELLKKLRKILKNIQEVEQVKVKKIGSF